MELKQVCENKKYRVQVEQMLHIAAPEGDIYRIAQGCAADGKYGYFILVSDTDGKGSVYKVDLSNWEIVKTAHGLPIDHGNDATYNEKTHELIVVNNAPHYDTLTVINPDALEVIRQVKIAFNAYAISYVAARDEYVLGISGSYDFMITDSDFNPLRRVAGVDTGYIKQGMHADEQYVYFPQWDHKNRGNCIVTYDYDGKLVNTLPVESTAEIESMFTVGNQLYIAFYKAGCQACRAEITEE